jgi:hypothetical protein
MSIDLRSHFREGSVFMTRHYSLRSQQRREQKIQLWNRFVDSGLIGITEEDCGILPRVLPLSYLKEIKNASYYVSLFAMRLLSLPAREIKAIIPQGPIRDFLINELEVLKYRPQRWVGSFRFDMALVGEAIKGNPPKLLEINEIGFGGLSRSTFLQNTMLELMPQLGENALILDAARAEIQNYQRLGTNFARFQYDAYDWEEEVLVREAARAGVKIGLVSPKQLNFDYDLIDYPMLHQREVTAKQRNIIIGGKWRPDAVQMGYSFELQDYLRAPEMYKKIVQSQTPQYSPFITGLVASKAILVLLSDRSLRQKLLGSGRHLESAILGAELLQGKRENVVEKPDAYVLKHVDGLGGEKVFFDSQLVRQLKKISPAEESEWVIQERTRLNTLELEGTLSRKRRVIADLGVFVQYDWNKDRFNHFEVGGFITRGTNKTFKVNVSEGGIQVPVFFDKGA